MDGNYELRYFTYGPHDAPTWTLKATSATIVVGSAAPPPPPQPPTCQFTVTASGANIPAGGQARSVTITPSQAGCAWTALSPVPWVRFSATGGVANSVTFTVAGAAMTSPRDTVLTIAGQQIAVNQAGVPPDGAAPTVTANASSGSVTVAVGSTIQVAVTGGASHNWDWVALAQVNAAEMSYVDWRYMNGTKVGVASPITSARFGIGAPATPGSYELRFFTWNGGSYDRLATSGAITVVASPGSPLVKINTTTTPITVVPGAALSVNVANAVGNVSDWVGLAAVGAAEPTYLDWWYLTGSKTEVGWPIPQSYFTIPAPAVDGNYELRYFTFGPHSGQIWTLKATSATLVVATPVPPANCQYTVTASGANVPAAGTARTATITADQVGCVWTASSPVPWVTFSATSGTANTLTFTIAGTTITGPRNAIVTIAGHQIAVNQAGIPSELIVNGDFESGFHDADPNTGSGLVADGWLNGANSNTATGYSVGGVTGDLEQVIADGSVNDGIFQSASIPPGRTYEFSADVFVAHGSAKLLMIVWGGPPPLEVLSIRQGAQRLRLQFSQTLHPYGPLNVTYAVVTGQGGSTIRVDHVSLRALDEVVANERVTNGAFDGGFYTFGDANGSGQLGHSWTHLGQSTPPQGFFHPGGPGAGTWQDIDGGGKGTGLQQTILLQAGQNYVVQTNVLIANNGGVNLSIGPAGAAVQRVYACGPSNTWHELALLYTAPFTGQYTVGVKSHIPQTYYAVDDITVKPSGRTFVQAYTGGTGTECIQMHNLTFQVHDSVTQDLLEGATIEIAPNYGSGPPRFTYPDGTLTYQVGDGPMMFTVSKVGYLTQTSGLDTTGHSTMAVALLPVSTAGGGSGGGGGGGGGPTDPPVLLGHPLLSATAVSPSVTTWTVLVNGSFNSDSIPAWMQTGSLEFNAIATTFGVSPLQHHWQQSGATQVVFPYTGIYQGANALADFLDNLPTGDVNIVAHSHGGNVAIMTTWMTERSIRNLVNLGTPVNWDLQRAVKPGSVYARCLISSRSDLVQFLGASPSQQYYAGYYMSEAVRFAKEAVEALLVDDYTLAAALGLKSDAAYDTAQEYFDSTRIEEGGRTILVPGASHWDLHEPPVWNIVAQHCIR